jgi:hypothetical protein
MLEARTGEISLHTRIGGGGHHVAAGRANTRHGDALRVDIAPHTQERDRRLDVLDALGRVFQTARIAAASPLYAAPKASMTKP